MQYAGVLVFLLPLIPALAWVGVAIAANASSRRRIRELGKRLQQLSAAAAHLDTPPDRPRDWSRILEAIGALAQDPEELERCLAPVTETAGPLFERWFADELEQLSQGSMTARQRRRLRGHLSLLRRARRAAPIPDLANGLLEGDAATAGAVALLIGDHAEHYADAAIPLAVALRTGPPQAAPAIAWALQRVLVYHSQLIPVLAPDPAPIVRRVALRAADASLAVGSKPASLLSLIEEGTRDSDPEIRVLAYGACRHLKSARRLELAEVGLADPVPDVARAAVRAIASEGGASATEILIRTLRNASPELRSEALSHLKPTPEIPSLAPSDGWLGTNPTDTDAASKAWALEVRAVAGLLAEADVLKRLQHPQAEVRCSAARSLTRIADRSQTRATPRDWLPQLLAAWQQEDHPEVILALADGLAAASTDVASEVILKRLSEVSDWVRERLLEVLARAELFSQIEAIQPQPGPQPVAGEVTLR